MLSGNRILTDKEKKQFVNKIRYLAQIGKIKRVLKVEQNGRVAMVKHYDSDYESEIRNWEVNNDSAISDITDTITVNTHNGYDMTICIGVTKDFKMPSGRYEMYRTTLNDLCVMVKQLNNPSDDIVISNLCAAAINAHEWFVERYSD